MPDLQLLSEAASGAFEVAGLRDQVKILVVGAPVTQRFAGEIGAAGDNDSAAGAVARAGEQRRIAAPAAEKRELPCA